MATNNFDYNDKEGAHDRMVAEARAKRAARPWIACEEPERPADEAMRYHEVFVDGPCVACQMKADAMEAQGRNT